MSRIKNQDESPLCNDRTLRDKCVNHYEVLEKVKQLLLLPGTDMMSIDQVADYYEVTPEYIKILYSNNKGEIDLDGVEMFPRSYYDGSKLNITSVEKKQTSVTYTFEDGQLLYIQKFAITHMDKVFELSKEFTFKIPNESNHTQNTLQGKTFVITGSLEKYSNRDELKSVIESYGGKVSGSVSAKTFALINNDIESSSSKNKKAKSLDVQIINEEQFMQLIGE